MLHLGSLERFSVFIGVAALTLASLIVAWSAWFWLVFCGFAIISGIGVHDLLQTRHSILRNYPVIGHMRFLFRGHTAGNPAIPDRKRSGRGALFARRAFHRLSKSQGRRRQAALRHKAAGLRCGIYVADPFDSAEVARRYRFAGHDRRAGLPPALQRIALQHLGDELRRAFGQCDPCAQHGRKEGRICAGYRRRRHQPVSSPGRWRPDLRDRVRLFRMPLR
jgi:hypothetical protein